MACSLLSSTLPASLLTSIREPDILLRRIGPGDSRVHPWATERGGLCFLIDLRSSVSTFCVEKKVSSAGAHGWVERVET